MGSEKQNVKLEFLQFFYGQQLMFWSLSAPRHLTLQQTDTREPNQQGRKGRCIDFQSMKAASHINSSVKKKKKADMDFLPT